MLTNGGSTKGWLISSLQVWIQLLHYLCKYKYQHIFFFWVESYLVKLETSCPVILPPTVSILCSDSLQPCLQPEASRWVCQLATRRKRMRNNRIFKQKLTAAFKMTSSGFRWGGGSYLYYKASKIVQHWPQHWECEGDNSPLIALIKKTLQLMYRHIFSSKLCVRSKMHFRTESSST